jgi:hypothetical protein
MFIRSSSISGRPDGNAQFRSSFSPHFYLRQQRGMAIHSACVSLIDGEWALC